MSAIDPEGSRFQSYSKQPYRASVTLKPTPKRFKMPNILKFYGTINLHEQVLSFSRVIMGNNLTNDDIELVMFKKFGETPLGGELI